MPVVLSKASWELGRALCDLMLEYRHVHLFKGCSNGSGKGFLVMGNSFLREGCKDCVSGELAVVNDAVDWVIRTALVGLHGDQP